jgi:hypothetical protein
MLTHMTEKNLEIGVLSGEADLEPTADIMVIISLFNFLIRLLIF